MAAVRRSEAVAWHVRGEPVEEVGSEWKEKLQPMNVTIQINYEVETQKLNTEKKSVFRWL